MSETRTVEVKYDPELHQGHIFDDPVEREMWAAVDTSFNLLREAAVRVTLKGLREQAKKAGITYPSDEEIFNTAPEGAPKTFPDLAPEGCPQVRGLHAAVFEHLLTEASEDMEEAIHGQL